MADYTIKELLTTARGTEGSLLIPRLITPLVNSVDRKRLPRELAKQYFGPESIPGSSIDINLVDEDTSSVTRVAEGAPIPIFVSSYSNTNVKPAKYGGRPQITKEMLEDSLHDLMANEMEQTGRQLADNENTLVITALDGAANTVSGGAAITIANITRARQYLHDNDYQATDLIIGPEVENDLMNIDTFVEADKTGGAATPSTNLIGTIFGMRVWVVSPNAGITSTSAYVIDRSQAYVIAEKRPLTVENYDDKTHDVSGIVVTQRIAVSAIRTKAIAKITTS